MRVLVTGANGHIGFNLCRALVERGHTVRASVRSSAAPERVAALRALGAIEIVEERRGAHRACHEGEPEAEHSEDAGAHR